MGDVVRLGDPLLTEATPVQKTASETPRLAPDDVGDLLYLDRVSVSFPVRDFDPSVFRRKAQTSDLGGEITSESMSVSVSTCDDRKRGRAFVGVQYIAGVGFFGKVEANPSPWHDPDGWDPMPMAEWSEVETRLVDVLDQTGVVPAVEVADWRVKRLDFARPFSDVGSPSFYLRGLAPLKRKHAQWSRVYADPAKGSAQTLHAGSGAGAVRLYDRYEAYRDPSLRGSMQWEVQANAGWLESFGVVRVRDMTPARLRTLVADRWEWSRMGTAVTGAADVVEVIGRMVRRGGYVDDDGVFRSLSPAKGKRLLGELVAEALGATWGDASRTTVAEYERVKRYLGVVPSPELLQGAQVSVSGRLDFKEGREVAA